MFKRPFLPLTPVLSERHDPLFLAAIRLGATPSVMFLLFSVLWLSPLSPQGPPIPRVYEAQRVTAPITLDGELGDPGWAQAPWTEDFVDILGAEADAPTHRTRAKMVWDDQYLYVGAELNEPHLWATLRERDAIIYRDDDFEVFLDPDGDGLEYFEIEVNAYNTVLDLFLNQPYNKGGRANIGWDLPGLLTGVSLTGTLNNSSDTDRRWTVEIAIPWEDLVPPGSAPGRPPEPGDTWRVNFSRVDWPLEPAEHGYRKTREPSEEDRHPESNWVWSPQGAINMHIPEMWGVVRFTDDLQNPIFERCQ